MHKQLIDGGFTIPILAAAFFGRRQTTLFDKPRAPTKTTMILFALLVVWKSPVNIKKNQVVVLIWIPFTKIAFIVIVIERPTDPIPKRQN